MGTRQDPGETASPVVVRITPGSPVAKAGLLVGDRVLAIDSVALVDQADMVAQLAAADDHVTLDIDRKGRTLQLSLEAEPIAPPQKR